MAVGKRRRGCKEGVWMLLLVGKWIQRGISVNKMLFSQYCYDLHSTVLVASLLLILRYILPLSLRILDPLTPSSNLLCPASCSLHSHTASVSFLVCPLYVSSEISTANFSGHPLCFASCLFHSDILLCEGF